MNRSEIRTLVREYINEPVAAFWTDASLNRLINIAMPKVHNRIKSISRYHFTTRVTFPTVAGTEYYNLPTDCKDVKMLTRFNSEGRELPLTMAPWPDPTAFTPLAMLDPTAGTGEDGPSVFWVVGRALRILPRPASVVTLKLYYEARLTNLTDDADIPTLDADYHDMIAKWAAIEAGLKNNQRLEEITTVYNMRDQDLLQDVFHRVPAPPQETESYISE